MHLLHDLHVVKAAHADEQYVALTTRTHALRLAYARAKQHPCQALAKRLLRHEDELFQFVLVEGLSADNNLAEWNIRPLVVIRKIKCLQLLSQAAAS